MHIILMRHAQSIWNADTSIDRFNGRADIPLSETGSKQAAQLSLALTNKQINTVYTSPLKRAFNTANVIAKQNNISLEVEDKLIEFDFGLWEGLTIKEIQYQWPEEFNNWIKDPASYRVPKGECGYDVAARVMPFLSNLFFKHKDQCIVLVAHKVVNRIILSHFLGLPISKFRYNIPQRTASINEIIMHDINSYEISKIDHILY